LPVTRPPGAVSRPLEITDDDIGNGVVIVDDQDFSHRYSSSSRKRSSRNRKEITAPMG
jgi:hypothetical protein